MAPRKSPPTWSGFHRLGRAARLKRVADFAGLTAAERNILEVSSALPMATAERFIENAAGTFPLPLGFAVGFVVDSREAVVPMAVEESSVVAAASHGAKLATSGGGFRTKVGDPVAIGQVEVRGVKDLAAACDEVKRRAKAWRRDFDAFIPNMARRGGGVRAIEPRVVGDRLVVHLHVDTQDAMGANVVNTLCEAAAPSIAKATGGRAGLRILSNLATERLVTSRCRVPAEALGGKDAVRAIVEADRFAHLDPYRAATHNKGVMNGIDPLLIATGNDWRAVEAGAHAYAARDGAYRALTRYRVGRGGALEGGLTLPMAVGTVGGVTRLHPVARICLKVLGNPDGKRLAALAASVGLAQNLAALKALAGEGIQRGHMALHARNIALRTRRRGS